jgi:hypothetical protein
LAASRTSGEWDFSSLSQFSTIRQKLNYSYRDIRRCRPEVGSGEPLAIPVCSAIIIAMLTASARPAVTKTMNPIWDMGGGRLR